MTERPPDRNNPGVAPRILALEALIEASLEALATDPQGDAAAALLFIGHWNDALPRLLIHDPVLEPVDKIVWAVIKTCTDPQRGTAFPSYGTIGRLANVASDSTVARALAILRATRWMTLCGRARDRRGRFRGSVYALHDEPLSLCDTLHLDPNYLAFTRTAIGHGHPRVRTVADAVFRSIGLDVTEGLAVEAPTDPIVARAEAQAAIDRREAAPGVAAPTSPPASKPIRALLSRSFSIRSTVIPAPTEDREASMDRLRISKAVPDASETETDHRLRISKQKTGALRNSKSPNSKFSRGSNEYCLSVFDGSSSCSKETTTTIAADHGAAQNSKRVDQQLREPRAAVDPKDHEWPDWLSRNARHLASLELGTIPVGLRQPLIQLLDQRHRDGRQGAAEALHSPIQYLRSLCQLYRAGKLAIRANGDAPAKPAATESAQTEGQIRRKHLRQRLRTAEADHQHWIRRIQTSRDDSQKAEWQNLADRARAEADRYRQLIAQADDKPDEP